MHVINTAMKPLYTLFMLVKKNIIKRKNEKRRTGCGSCVASVRSQVNSPPKNRRRKGKLGTEFFLKTTTAFNRFCYKAKQSNEVVAGRVLRQNFTFLFLQ
jgi:hypothetical protein